jgi:hypothetical protein
VSQRSVSTTTMEPVSTLPSAMEIMASAGAVSIIRRNVRGMAPRSKFRPTMINTKIASLARLPTTPSSAFVYDTGRGRIQRRIFLNFLNEF